MPSTPYPEGTMVLFDEDGNDYIMTREQYEDWIRTHPEDAVPEQDEDISSP